MKALENVKFNHDGLVPAIVQDSGTNEVLMLAYMNRQALELTISTGKTHFYSRSRRTLWCKGETSGNVQHVDTLYTDCDYDTILVKVTQKGAACHEGFRTCFHNLLESASQWKVVGSRLFDPDKVYGKNK
ncbi:MAG: phosphoribosyl-AMP cyclohydrolase [Candidatus Abyssobacteria bacterium SURF_5]|uniref:Phosphoribosyl-AMP cyclohydrolase n=1 Tax=Abyssobacteria bacterium (strain SURF_5) TaxID=2093360 RepID=A0A3A4NYM4_ABYX5|nr:MAG: phosphoribosyl-AMP cyclohydrolase [Candidatus Abyssubacteria bacterium SURF_5]